MVTPQASDKPSEGESPAVIMTARQLVVTVCLLLLVGGGLMTLGIWMGMRQSDTRSGPLDSVTRSESPNQDALSRVRGRQASPVDYGTLEGADVQENVWDVVPPEHGDDVDAPSPSGDAGLNEEVPREGETASAPPVHESEAGETLGEPLDVEDDSRDEATDSIDASSAPSADDAAERDSMETVRPMGEGPMYSIQVAAFRASERDKAEAFAAAHEPLAPELVVSPDGDWVRVLVGRYSTRAEAVARQQELREQDGFEDSWVQQREP